MSLEAIINDLNIENEQIDYIKLKSFSDETYSQLLDYFLENDIAIVYALDNQEPSKDLDLVRLFFNDIKDVVVKTKEEQYQLFKQYKEEGLTSARRQLIECNIRYVIFVAKHFTNDNNVLLDAVQDGCLGLIKAIDKFDYRLGNAITTYATWWISQEIRAGLIERNSVLYFPKSKDQEIKQLKRAINCLSHCLNREPTVYEIHQKTNLSEARIMELLENINLQDSVSLNIEISSEDETELGDLIASNECPDPQEVADHNNRQVVVLKAIASLPPLERDIIMYRYGFIDNVAHTLQETQEAYNLALTVESIRQKEKKAIKKLALCKGLRIYE